MEEERMRTVWLMQQIISRDGRGWWVMYSWPRVSGQMVENGSLTIYLAGVKALGKLNFRQDGSFAVLGPSPKTRTK